MCVDFPCVIETERMDNKSIQGLISTHFSLWEFYFFIFINMSHFTVLVIGEEIEEALAPFHEFECTWEDNEFVQNISQLEEAKKEYSEYSRRVYVDPEGKYHAPYNDEFYRDPTPEEQEKHSLWWMWCGGWISWTSKDWWDGRWYRPKVSFIPEWWEEKSVSISELETFREWASDYYGKKIINKTESPDLQKEHKYWWMRVDENWEVIEMIGRTNPNSHWDWYEIGGRWAWQIFVKEWVDRELPNFSWGWSNEEKVKVANERRTDSALIKEIDMEKMIENKRKNAEDTYNSVKKWERIWISRSEKEFIDSHTLEEYLEEYMEAPISTYAVVMKNSEWKYEWTAKWEMWWFWCSHESISEKEWSEKYKKFISELSPDTRITFVDCHT